MKQEANGRDKRTFPSAVGSVRSEMALFHREDMLCVLA